jgi:hypothetical protein
MAVPFDAGKIWQQALVGQSFMDSLFVAASFQLAG